MPKKITPPKTKPKKIKQFPKTNATWEKIVKERKYTVDSILEERKIGACFDKGRLNDIFRDLGYKAKDLKAFEVWMTGSTVGMAVDGDAMIPLYYYSDVARFLKNKCNKKTRTLD